MSNLGIICYPENHRSMICLYESGYLGLLPDGSIMIPKEVEEVYNTFKGTDFNEKRKKISYFIHCLRTAKLLYGIVPIDIFMKLINVNTDISMTKEEVREEIKNIPVEFADYLLIRDKIYSKELWPDDGNLLLAQDNKEYYIPTLIEIMDIGLLGYLPDSKEMIKLKKFLQNKLEAMEDEADFACAIIQNIIREEGEISNIFNMLEELGLYFENERQIEEFIKLIDEVWNNTRMIVNRGFKPGELLKYEKLVPIVKNTNDVGTKVVPIDVSKRSKVYPNDPCPCGSGKKYKNCCKGK